ncbi:hypothetical protein ACQ4PT_004384 [Festuca glaucescens]
MRPIGDENFLCSVPVRDVSTGRNSDYFSVEINHGGYFLGQVNNRSYVDGVVVCFDHVDSRTWSPAVLEDLVEDLGYEMKGRMTVYYLIPILTIGRNGLRCLEDEIDTNGMANFVGIGHHYISVYLNHDESIRAIDWDDVVEFPAAELPPVLSPLKPVVLDDDAHEEVEDAPVPLQVVHAEEGVRTRSKSKLIHNRGGCKWRKAGLPDPRTTNMPPPPPPETEPITTQIPEDNTINPTNVDVHVVETMSQQRTLQRETTAAPTPESTFIADARANQSEPQVRPSTLQQGDLARQLQAMQAQKNKELEDKRTAILEAK